MAAHKKSSAKVSNLKKAVFGFAAASLIAVGGVSTVSAFSDEATSNITVKAGTIDLQLNNAKTTTIALPTTMKPGDVLPAQTITVRNTGSIPLKYTVTSSSAAGSLADVLDVTIKKNVADTTGTKSKLSAVNIPSTSVAAGTTETFSVQVTWPQGSNDNSYQGKDGATTLNFVATS